VRTLSKGIVSIALASLGALNAQAGPADAARVALRLEEPGGPGLALQVQRAKAARAGEASDGDVVYVHGGTFGADLSVFYRVDGQSWADRLNAAGFDVWGFDFAGYGSSDRYAQDARPAGRLDDVLPQLRRVVAAVRARNGGRPVALVAHSWGGAVAARYAGTYPQDVKALVLFAPITARTSSARAAAASPLPSHHELTMLAQYRRFVEDVPRGRPQVLDEAQFLAWSVLFLATDPAAAKRLPPSVALPFGPVADIGAAWSGHALYDPAVIRAPTLLARGEWDSLCTDTDAARLLAGLGSEDKSYVTIERATHLMHLESQRTVLQNATNAFLERVMR
jgi:alpha-beta hydrolase superfamily lysophospholipase